MEIKKNDEFCLTIEDMNEDGEGVGKLDGYIWFVKDTVMGDRIKAKAMKMKKNYGYARLMEILTPSPHRVTPPCPVARQCGGCQLQSMSYEQQLVFKEKKIYNNLVRIGKFQEIPMEPIIGMDHPWRYRNKAQFPFGLDGQSRIITGFYAGRTHQIIPCQDCLLGIEQNEQILERIKKYMETYRIQPYDEQSHSGLVRHALIRYGFQTGQLMVCLVIHGKQLPHSEKLVESLLQVEGMTSISFNINQEKTNVILGNKVVNLFGPGYIVDYIGPIQYQISPLSFYQVNPVQTKKLYETALEYAGLTGDEVVWDLYCGIGTISLFLAQKARKVYGVEIVEQAILDARNNAKRNGMDHVEFFVGKAEEVLPKQYETNRIAADVIVVDPPRKGCDILCLETMVKMQPKRIVYISCDSATLARDLRYLCDRGFEVKRVRGCDMFGMSGHVESIILMTKCGFDKK